MDALTGIIARLPYGTVKTGCEKVNSVGTAISTLRSPTTSPL